MNQTKVGAGSEYISESRLHNVTSNVNWLVDTGAATGTSIFYANNSSDVNLYTSGMNSSYLGIDDQYKVGQVKGKVPKKKRGDRTGANDLSQRLHPLGSPVVIFRIMKERFNMMEIGKLERRMEQMGKLLTKVEPGQIALTEELELKLTRIMREAEMAACGFTKFISKKLLNKFEEMSSRKIVVTKLKNYARLIPDKVKAKMAKADEKGLFDGYVVVHTDPDNKAVKKTMAEKRDPILFGVIAESDDFYFVGDWIDELCDLTMDEIVEKLDLGKEEFTFESNFGKRLEAALA